MRSEVTGKRYQLFLAMAAIAALVLCLEAKAASDCPLPLGKILSVEGNVFLNRSRAALDDPVCPGDNIETDTSSRAAVWFAQSETVIRLDQLSRLEIPGAAPEVSVLELLRGALYFFSRTPQRLEIKAPFVNATIEGTEFVLRTTPDRNEIVVYEGVVSARNGAGETEAGAKTILTTGGPQAVPVQRRFADQAQLRDALVHAVDWALYYPPLFDGDTLTIVDPAVARAARLLRVGQATEAITALPADSTDSDADSLALKSLIALVRGAPSTAHGYLERSLSIEANSVAALLAKSYFEQARFDLPAAIQVTLEAQQIEPSNPLVLARLSELYLATGHLREAQELAEAAVGLAPDLPQTQVILGFASLIRLDVPQAEQAFEHAIALDSSMPLPRLGLGLALVRGGDLAGGRKQFERVIALDPLRSLYRSYLGKAYYEEKRDDEAETEFMLAKELNTRDPTPWLYSAILELTRNQPISALHDLQQSIRLNDNRAVFRSKLGLDEDLASRSVSLARIYDELGYEDAAILTASKALDIDPGNFSAHRFLADAYASTPGHEVASVSELLQSQLLQPINILPVQPQLAVTDLAVVAGLGPAAPSLNEYTPLFQSDGPRFLVSLLGGNQNTWGDELVLSGIHRRLSYSLGQFHTESDGFRDNNDATYDIYNAYAQFALSPQMNFQIEARRRQSEQGDLRLRFDPEAFDPTYRRSIDQDTLRVGARYSPSPADDVLLSVVTSDRDEKGRQRSEPVSGEQSFVDRQSGYQAEARYLHQGNAWNMSFGGGRYDVDEDLDGIIARDPILPPPLPQIPGRPPLPPLRPIIQEPRLFDQSFNTTHNNAYVYGNLSPHERMEVTLGLSYDDFSAASFDINELNPKFGLRWQATEWLQARVAAFRVVKRMAVLNQTIEPTQIAGFNQFFDDYNGTRSTRYGFGLDFRPSESIMAGVELSKWDMSVPILNPVLLDVIEDDQDVTQLSAYGYWTLTERWALRAQVSHEEFDSDSPITSSTPSRLDTTIAPLALNYHHPSGWFADLGASYIRQKIRRQAGLSTLHSSDTDDGVIVDAALGFRLPKRRGIVNLSVGNLFDNQINFQDNGFRTPTQNVRIPFATERTIRLVVSLNF